MRDSNGLVAHSVGQPVKGSFNWLSVQQIQAMVCNTNGITPSPEYDGATASISRSGACRLQPPWAAAGKLFDRKRGAFGAHRQDFWTASLADDHITAVKTAYNLGTRLLRLMATGLVWRHDVPGVLNTSWNWYVDVSSRYATGASKIREEYVGIYNQT